MTKVWVSKQETRRKVEIWKVVRHGASNRRYRTCTHDTICRKASAPPRANAPRTAPHRGINCQRSGNQRGERQPPSRARTRCSRRRATRTLRGTSSSTTTAWSILADSRACRQTWRDSPMSAARAYRRRRPIARRGTKSSSSPTRRRRRSTPLRVRWRSRRRAAAGLTWCSSRSLGRARSAGTSSSSSSYCTRPCPSHSVLALVRTRRCAAWGRMESMSQLAHARMHADAGVLA